MPMRFLPSTSFLPEQEAAVLLPELARVCRQLGVQFVRASVVDVHTLAYRAAWSITEHGDIAPTNTDRTVDGAFPGAASAIASLADAEPEDTLVHRQSPRRWAFSWSLDSRLAVVAEVQYRERRDNVGDIDRVLVRLLCSASVRGHTLDEADTIPAVPELVWPQVDRRARAQPPVPLWLALGLSIGVALLLGWASLGLLPQARQAAAEQRSQAEAQHARADVTLTHSLSTALSTGDYGEVQQALTQFLQQGYFRSAVVINDRGLAVAMGGPVERLRIGEPVSLAYANAARALELTLGPTRLGRLYVVGAPLAAEAPLATLHLASGAGAAAALVATGLLAWQLRSTRRRRG